MTLPVHGVMAAKANKDTGSLLDALLIWERFTAIHQRISVFHRPQNLLFVDWLTRGVLSSGRTVLFRLLYRLMDVLRVTSHTGVRIL